MPCPRCSQVGDDYRLGRATLIGCGLAFIGTSFDAHLSEPVRKVLLIAMMVLMAVAYCWPLPKRPPAESA